MTGDVLLRSGSTVVTVAVAAGGRIARIVAEGEELLIEPQADPTSIEWGVYPMAPWAGRIRHGRFQFLGTDHQLVLNRQDGPDSDPDRRHAMHGTVYSRPWIVDELNVDSISLSCPVDVTLLPGAEPSDVQVQASWPFPGTARHTIRVEDRTVRCELSVHPSAGPMPIEIGWHPWFRKPTHVEFSPEAMYRRDEIGLPTGELVAPSEGPWDDCFVNAEPVRLHYDRAAAPTVTVTSDCDHWVVFDERAHATCVEPQSGPPDAVNLRPRIGDPAHPVRRTMTIGW